MTASRPVHPAVAALSGLLGTWEGEGAGHYPTIASFEYRERVSFTHTGKPFLAYQQRTWAPSDGQPLHAETGYLRIPTAAGGAVAAGGPVTVELMLAHPTGIVEVEEGHFADGVLHLATTTIGLTSSAKLVRSLRRELRLEGDELAYDLWMAHADTPETHHLRATLSRTA